ncbi:30S ribosomal protein S8 [Candidatus Woesearchaeota archaeon]|nr:30S ribosomal protein S8 [Candidatus Woesearchaeota archaeon]
MTLNDSLANALTTIGNAEKVGKRSCVVRPSSNVIKRVLGLLNETGYVGGFEETESEKGSYLTISLLGRVNRISVIKPRFEVKADGYEKFEKRFLPAKGFGIIIVSTSQGMMGHAEAQEKRLGGRLIAYCY